MKDELNRIFHRKCAYCESKYEHLIPIDVEHYRPKSAVLEEDGRLSKPGYYWLGAEWTNLLPSCVGCNRERKQFQRQKDGTVVEAKSGKGNKFPLAPRSRRGTRPNEHLKETPVLLNPCIDRPERHLEFTDGGFVRPKNSPEEQSLPKGDVTIKVLGLARAELVEARAADLGRFLGEMKVVCRSKLRLRLNPDDATSQDDLDAAETALKTLAELKRPYLAMVREVMRSFRAVLRAIEVYWQAVDAFNANLSNMTLEQQVSGRVAALKRYLRASRPHHQLARSMMDWVDIKTHL